jgi:Na+-transporting NADH:ubiquinone oxidoreductase subunit F
LKLLTLRRLHRWVALVVGLQVLAWATGGVVFAWLDHHAIEGEGLAAPPAVRPLAGDRVIVEPGALGLGAAAVDSLALQSVDGQWVYRIATARGVELRRARDGAPFRIDQTVARALATAAYRGEGRLSALHFHSTPTREARDAGGATWQAEFDDATGTSLYFSAADGELVAVRTDAWRLKDFFWMLHTMDYRGRDDFNHPLVVVAAAAALWVAATGVWLLWRVFRRKGASG